MQGKDTMHVRLLHFEVMFIHTYVVRPVRPTPLLWRGGTGSSWPDCHNVLQSMWMIYYHITWSNGLRGDDRIISPVEKPSPARKPAHSRATSEQHTQVKETVTHTYVLYTMTDSIVEHISKTRHSPTPQRRSFSQHIQCLLKYMLPIQNLRRNIQTFPCVLSHSCITQWLMHSTAFA